MADSSNENQVTQTGAGPHRTDVFAERGGSDRLKGHVSEFSAPAFERLAQSNRRLKLLTQLANNLILGDKPREQLNAAFDGVAKELGASFYFNYRTDEARPDTLFLESSRGPAPDQLHPLSQIAFGQHLCGQVAQSRRPLIVEDLQSLTDDATAEARAMGVKAYAGVPLMAHGHLYGTLCIGSTDTPRFSSFDIAFLTTLADQYAAMLDRTRLLTNLRDHDRGMVIEVANRKRAEEKLIETSAMFSALVDQAPMGIYVVDGEFCLQQINAVALPVFKSAQPLMGRDFSAIIEIIWGRELGKKIERIFRHTLDTGEAYISPPFSEYRQDIGVEQSYDWQIQRMTLSDGSKGVICYFNDVTHRNRIELKLIDSQARLRHAAEAASLTYVEVDFVADRLHTAENFKAVMGYASPPNETANATVGSKLLLDHVAPQDRQRVETALQDFLAGSSMGKIEYCVHGDDLIKRTIESVWSSDLDANGKPIRAFATNVDISDRKQTEQKMRVSEIRYRRLFEAAQDGVLLLDPETSKITDANPFMTKLLGYSHGELVGKQLFEIGMLKDESASRVMFEKLKTDRQVRYDDLPLKSRGGLHQDVEVVANLYDENGQDVIQCNIREITARKQAEAHTNLLMSEVIHRSKNMLGVVQAVARQTARGGDPATFIARLSDRINGLAVISDLLVLNDWKGIEVPALVRGQLAHFQDLIGSRILLTGKEVRLTPAAAQGIGMALHELGTNAAKYGALSSGDGRVHIDWHVTTGESPEFVISWLEDGGPPVSAPARTGFGQMVIGRMAEASVNGAADIEYRESGLCWTLRSPIENTLEMATAFRNQRAY